jgi:hypothetical protein
MTDTPKSRPSSVTTVVVLTWIAGILDVVAGIAFLAFSRSDTLLESIDSTSSNALFLGIGMIVLGLIVLGVAGLLGAGSKGARLAVTVLMVVRIFAHTWAWIALGTAAMTESVVAILFAVLIVVLLWNKKANTFFGS